MREVNFSIPNANKASVGITTALYDRRALDCTSTLPLINSLNHLAYLTTSSARIRDILTVDGGIERLICILKEGRSKDMMDMWKWNLAFQCIFNIGVRGSENVRTRVVEADMVPVIATILDNYIQVVDKCREKAENEIRRAARLGGSSRHQSSRSGEMATSSGHRAERTRRAIPPPIEIPQTFGQTPLESQPGDTTPTPAFSPVQPAINIVNANPPPPWYPRYSQDRNATAGVLAAMPRDEDVLMSLQLLAYVSKYCNLRSYFQQSHLVPKLKIGSDLQLLDGEASSPTPMLEEEELEEYELPDDFNIFPLVEKFTVRHHTSDMRYWASVVMRNLCRKDDSRGGIRQCAYYQCGKWEEYTRQFAKCRRCRRTKYCSKECQKSAWVFHRHWCVAAN